MKLAILCTIIGLTGYVTGSKLRNSKKNFKWISIVQLAAIAVLIFAMGAKIGANEKLIESLPDIGVASFVLTALALAGSIGGVFLVRKLFGYNKEGQRLDD